MIGRMTWRQGSVASVARYRLLRQRARPDQLPAFFEWRDLTFAAKTTASALLALLIAFRFNLDQPQWALLTVFIVAQPRQDALVLAKGAFRIAGTVVGAAIALVLVSAAAQERLIFLGGLSIWLAACTFGSVAARGFAGYGCVLAGYTAAIIG